MKLFYVSIGSNYQALDNISNALDILKNTFETIFVSSIYKNLALDKRTYYFNLVVSFYSDTSFDDVKNQLKKLEADLGRMRCGQEPVPVPIDLDIIIVKDLRCQLIEFIEHERILQHSFVLAPLSEISGNMLCPKTDKTYQQLWAEFNKNLHPLELIFQ